MTLRHTTPLRISLLVPCHDAAAYLPELFETVRAQTTPFAEVICYDDGSTDGTAAVAADLGARVVRGERNRGAGFARNRLLEASTCEWVHFHDADDLLLPGFVERMSVRAAGHGGVVLCGMRTLDRATRRPVGLVSYEALNDPETDPVAYFIEHFGFGIVGVYPRDALLGIAGFDERLRGNEDPDLHVRLALAGVRFAAEPEPLVVNLMHEGSYSARNRLRCLEDQLACLEAYEEVIGAPQRRALGTQAINSARALHQAGAPAAMRRAVRLARRCGIEAIDSRSRIVRTVSRLVGIEWSIRARALAHRAMGGRHGHR